MAETLAPLVDAQPPGLEVTHPTPTRRPDIRRTERPSARVPSGRRPTRETAPVTVRHPCWSRAAGDELLESHDGAKARSHRPSLSRCSRYSGPHAEAAPMNATGRWRQEYGRRCARVSRLCGARNGSSATGRHLSRSTAVPLVSRGQGSPLLRIQSRSLRNRSQHRVKSLTLQDAAPRGGSAR